MLGKKSTISTSNTKENSIWSKDRGKFLAHFTKSDVTTSDDMSTNDDLSDHEATPLPPASPSNRVVIINSDSDNADDDARPTGKNKKLKSDVFTKKRKSRSDSDSDASFTTDNSSDDEYTPEPLAKKRRLGSSTQGRNDLRSQSIKALSKKRGRGRPRKNPLQCTTTQNVALLQTSSLVVSIPNGLRSQSSVKALSKKRGRGRPRKNPLQCTLTTQNVALLQTRSLVVSIPMCIYFKQQEFVLEEDQKKQALESRRAELELQYEEQALIKQEQALKFEKRKQALAKRRVKLVQGQELLKRKKQRQK